MAQELRATISFQTNPFAVLDIAWAEINALDGEMFGAIDQLARERMKGYKAAIKASLDTLEQMGGQDPLTRAPKFPTPGIRNPAPNEYEAAVSSADRLLDLPGQDPDSDEMRVCRQFLRAVERLKECHAIRQDLVGVIVDILRACDELDGESNMNALQRAADMIGWSKQT